MEKIDLKRDRGREGYYNFAINKYGAIPIDEFRLKMNSETFKDGDIFLIEDNLKRILSLEYQAGKDFELIFRPDEKYDYAIIFFCNDLIYNIKAEKQLQLKIPTGFIIFKNSEKIVFPRKEGSKIQRVTLYLKKEFLSDYMQEKFSGIKDFAFHKGDDHTALWKKTYYDKGPVDIHENFITQWRKLKLEELLIITQNILFNYNDSEKKKVYQDYEFESVFEIREYLQNHLEEKPIMADLAKKYGINSTKLNEIFKYCFSQTIYKFYKHTRIHKVREQIITTHKSLTEIAYEYGFSDINHLSKSFIEEFGEKPSDLKISSKDD